MPYEAVVRTIGDHDDPPPTGLRPRPHRTPLLRRGGHHRHRPRSSPGPGGRRGSGQGHAVLPRPRSLADMRARGVLGHRPAAPDPTPRAYGHGTGAQTGFVHLLGFWLSFRAAATLRHDSRTRLRRSWNPARPNIPWAGHRDVAWGWPPMKLGVRPIRRIGGACHPPRRPVPAALQVCGSSSPIRSLADRSPADGAVTLLGV